MVAPQLVEDGRHRLARGALVGPELDQPQAPGDRDCVAALSGPLAPPEDRDRGERGDDDREDDTLGFHR